MSVALKNKLVENVVDLINDYYDKRKPLEWEKVITYKYINGFKHWITYEGNPNGGYVYFYKVKKSGWYKWHKRINSKDPVYEWISPRLGYKIENNTSYLAVLPHDFDPNEEWGDDENDIHEVLNKYMMENSDSDSDSDSESDSEEE